MIEFAENLYRGPMLKSLEETAAIQRSGIRTVINLQASNQNESQWWCYKVGIRQIEIALCPVAPPDEKQVDRVLEMLQDGRLWPIYLHCRAGVDRTGFVVARYRMEVQKWDQAAATHEMVEMGNHIWLRWWCLFL